MASISTDSNGLRMVQFIGTDAKRHKIRLGRSPMKVCEIIKRHVENIVSAQDAKASIERETAKWLGDIDADLHRKLVAVGLTTPRTTDGALALGPFIESYIAKRADVKPATKEIWGQGKRGLLDFFGTGKPLAEVSAGQADDYRSKLVAAKLAPMTIRKRLQFAKMIFRAAVRHRLIALDPFADVTVKVVMSDRHRFVTPPEAVKLVQACAPRSGLALYRRPGTLGRLAMPV